MRLRFVRVLVLVVLSFGAFAGVARALDFDDENPHPPHPEIGLVYHYEIGTHAGCLPHHLVILSGQLPPGLQLTQLNDHTGLVSGIATESGTFSVWLAVRDCENKSAETLFTFDVWVRRFAIATESLVPADLGSAYSARLATSGIPSNTTWEVVSGSLPAGLTLSKDGVVSGTPTAVGSSTFAVQATGVAKDFTGTRIDSRQYTLKVLEPLSAKISRRTAEVGVSFRANLTATGGQAPYTWSATNVPPGLNVGPDGNIGGKPTHGGSYVFDARVTDAGGIVKDIQMRLIIRPRLTIATKHLPAGAVGHPYQGQLKARGGVEGLRWAIVRGVPPGLKLSAKTGRIFGAPGRVGRFRITVQVRDALGAASTRLFVLNVR